MTQPGSEYRAYDRILERAAAQMATVSPLPDLARAAQEAGVPLEEAHVWFADANTLCAVVIEQQLLLLTNHLTQRTSVAPPDDVVAQLRALIHAYINWFFDNPIGGRLLISPPAMNTVPGHDVRRFSDAIYQLAQSMMERARDNGMIRADIDVPEFMLMMRALTLGIVLLQDLDHARMWGNPTDPREALTRMMNSCFDRALTKNPDESQLMPNKVPPS